MGKVYYDMGFLSKAEVVSCSASDLVGEYIGHTGPKTRKLLESALGKVLFIDEAYRLSGGHFAQEAIDELVDSLTNERFFRKQIVILAGYDADINRLMSVNPGLTSRFPETIVFEPLPPQACLDLLIQVSLPAAQPILQCPPGVFYANERASTWARKRVLICPRSQLCPLRPRARFCSISTF